LPQYLHFSVVLYKHNIILTTVTQKLLLHIQQSDICLIYKRLQNLCRYIYLTQQQYIMTIN